MLRKSNNQNISLFNFIVIFSMLSILLPVFQNSYASKTKERQFTSALKGEIWIINSENIAVSKEPKTSATKEAFIRNLVTIVKPGAKVEILESKGFISPWKRVYVYSDKNKIFAEGWIIAETVKKSILLKTLPGLEKGK